jgi:hypothetical protein
VIVLLLTAGRRTQPAKTIQSVGTASSRHDIVLVTWHPPLDELADVVGEVVVLGPPGTPAHTATGAASLPVRIIGRLRDPGRMWRAVRRDQRVRALATRAGMIVSLDTPATLASWRLGKVSPAPEAVLGFDAAAALLAAAPEPGVTDGEAAGGGRQVR